MAAADRFRRPCPKARTRWMLTLAKLCRKYHRERCEQADCDQCHGGASNLHNEQCADGEFTPRHDGDGPCGHAEALSLSWPRVTRRELRRSRNDQG